MTWRIAADRPATIEPFVVPDVFVSGLAGIESLGDGCVRLVFYVNAGSGAGGTQPRDRIVTAKVILTASAIADTAAALMECVDDTFLPPELRPH